MKTAPTAAGSLFGGLPANTSLFGNSKPNESDNEEGDEHETGKSESEDENELNNKVEMKVVLDNPYDQIFKKQV